jgi:hypothetical protein
MAEIALLEDLRKFFASAPEEKINMGEWSEGRNRDGKNEEYSCLTAGCLAGWAAVYKPFNALGFKLDWTGVPVYHDIYEACYEAYEAFASFFKLDIGTTLWLTSPNAYPHPDRITKAQVLERLDYVIAFGKRPDETTEA